ncbi:hypothetical protein [Halopseudomonas sp.]|uniref:hypothetical protein n=1 Tax=Halopseudomonas sp. TaxID=2901191 RepID=UPI003003709B|tara:strand:+ start:439 stop:1197 length:759 start_codon:yes stop_codon:yes gene_type:complete
MKNCAYCGKSEKLTKEHIWPSTLIKKYEDLLTYNKSQNKLYKGDATIKDVCAECNNVHLGKLDFYLSSLFDTHLKNILKPGENAYLEYDYDQLLRALLKISFNSARSFATDKTIKTHKKFIKYILEGVCRGSIMLRLQIVTASKTLNTQDNTENMFKPEVLRCTDIDYDGALGNRFMIRMIAINSFWFYIIIPYNNEPPHKWREFLGGFCNWIIQPGVLVNPSSSKLEIPVEKTTFFHPQLLGSLLDANPGA